MNLNRSKMYWLSIVLSVSIILNVVLGIILFSKKPFVYQESTTTLFFIMEEIRPEYDTSVIDNALKASYFAQNVWEEKFGNKGTLPYSIVSGESLNSFYLKKLDYWVVTTEQTVGIWEWSPYAIFDSNKQIVIAFLCPLVLFD